MILSTSRGLTFSRLHDVTSLVLATISGEIPSAIDAIYTLNKIEEMPKPYGWLITYFAIWAVAPAATIGAYGGSWIDAAGSTLISLCAIVTLHICGAAGTRLSSIMIPFVVGLVSPLVWRVANGDQQFCHSTAQWLGPMLIHLPGSGLIWAIIELLQGSVVAGASRLSAAIIDAMVIAFAVTLGWQFFGRDMGQYLDGVSIGAQASLPASNNCRQPSEGIFS